MNEDAGRCLRCGRLSCNRRGHVPMTEPKWLTDFFAAEDERAAARRATPAASVSGAVIDDIRKGTVPTHAPQNSAGTGAPTTREGAPSRDQLEGGR